MERPNTTLGALRDELEKISAVRIGRTPMLASTAARQTGAAVKGLGKFFKNAAAPAGRFGAKSILAATGTGMALGAFGLHKGKKAVQDYQVGRAMRQSSEGQGG
jgi:hypothetical protein